MGKRALVLVPDGHDRLLEVAGTIKSALASDTRLAVSILKVSELHGTNVFLENDLVIIGTPALDGDICWPLQVLVDGLTHHIRDDLASKVISAFTVVRGEDASNAAGAAGTTCLDAILWSFRDTQATIVDPLVLHVADAPATRARKVTGFAAVAGRAVPAAGK